MDILLALENTGAAVTTTNTLKHATLFAEHDGLAGAILDHSLDDETCSPLCVRLAERGIPFLIYSGHQHIDGACEHAPHVKKPATHAALVSALEEMLLKHALTCA